MENVGLTGIVKWVARDPNGNIISEGERKNQLKNVGKTEIAKLIGYGLNGSSFRYIAVGSSNAENQPTQTALVNEHTDGGLARAEANISLATTNTTNDTVVFSNTWTLTASRTIEEVGVFNAQSGGTILGRLLTGTLSLYSGCTLQITYKVVIG